MDQAAKLRGAFIRGELGQLLKESDPIKRESAAREFHRYVEWWADSLTEDDRRAIGKQLSKLEHCNPLAPPSKSRR